MLAWGFIVGFVAAYDAWALKYGHETLSQALFYANKKPLVRFLTTGFWFILGYHLYAEKETAIWLNRLKSLQQQNRELIDASSAVLLKPTKSTRERLGELVWRQSAAGSSTRKSILPLMSRKNVFGSTSECYTTNGGLISE